eukprot:6157814-Pyramimonas_sp.AAC.1
MAAASGAEPSVLKKFFADSSAPEPVITFLLQPRSDGGFGLESVSDFASVFKETDYEDKLQSEVLDKVEAHKTDLIALARLRAAWQLARSELTKACKKRVDGAPDPDWDTPLPQDDELRRSEEFNEAYDYYACEVEAAPA